jgi:hypothetical protein
MVDQCVPIRQTVRTNAVRNAGCQDLLCPAATHSKKKLNRRPIDERARESFELSNHVVDFAIPSWLGGHTILNYVSAHLRKMQIF